MILKRYKPKSTEELQTLTDKNLIAYIKAERVRYYKFKANHVEKYGELPLWLDTTEITLSEIEALKSRAEVNEWLGYINDVQEMIRCRKLKENTNGNKS